MRISNSESSCFLIKHSESDCLYLMCSLRGDGTVTIGDYDGFEENDINYKYKFILNRGHSDQQVNIIGDKISLIDYMYPDTLDFSSKDSITLYIIVPNEIEHLRLNENGSDLDCVVQSQIMKCTVPKSHFDGKSGGYYYIHHENNNYYYINYESFGINVILSGKDSGNSGKINKYSFIIFILLCFVIL